jgi:hypothetical protein
MNSNLEVKLTGTGNTFLTTTLDPTTCACDNLLLEAHYTVFYDPSTTNSFNLTNVTVDLVYGQYTPKDCNEIMSMSRKTSWSFK